LRIGAQAEAALLAEAVSLDHVPQGVALQLVGELSGDYRVAGDIDCAGFDAGDGGGFRPIGVGGSLYTPFEGHFDGAGHVIHNLTIAGALENCLSDEGLCPSTTA
jgi:hypothetical protein